MDNELTSNLILNVFTQSDTHKIYMAISQDSDAESFEFSHDCDLIRGFMESIYDKQFLLIDSKELIGDINQLNIQFVKLIKYGITKDYTSFHMIFVYFTEYFDIDYVDCYGKLHEKLQNLIKQDFIKSIGGKEEFEKRSKKYKPVNKPSPNLFDLFMKT